MTCSQPDCALDAWARGVCNTHYVYMRRHGALPPRAPAVVANRKLTPRFCACGCGEYAAVDPRRNRISKFISGHNAKANHPRGTLKHGMEGTPTYNSWHSMKDRCHNPNNPSWKNYGGRGITVDERYLGDDGFQNFLADLGERPDGLTLDRIDNDGNYEPGNLRWASWNQQANNRRLPGSDHTAKRREKVR